MRAILFVFLAAILCFWGIGCGGSSKSTNPQIDESKTFTSSVTSGHTHTITITKVEIETPPVSGISRETSTTGHSHTFTMSQEQLTTVNGGTAVVVTTSMTSGHTHTFSIQKWF
jgi:hypothetical protein